MVQQIPSRPTCQTGLRIQNVISGWLRATLTELLGLPSLYVSVLGSTASSASRIFSTGISSLKLLVDSTSLSPRSFPRCRSSWTAASKNQHASGPRKKKNTAWQNHEVTNELCPRQQRKMFSYTLPPQNLQFQTTEAKRMLISDKQQQKYNSITQLIIAIDYLFFLNVFKICISCHIF